MLSIFSGGISTPWNPPEMEEFYVMAEFDSKSQEMKVIKISKDRSVFFDFPTLYTALKYHPSVENHPQFKQFLAFLNNSKPKNKDKYVRNLKFSVKDINGDPTPEARIYINNEGKFRVKIDNFQHLATPEEIYHKDVSSIRLNYSGKELLEKFSKFID